MFLNMANAYLYAGAWAGRDVVSKGIRSFAYDVAARRLEFIGTFGDYNGMSCLRLDGDLLLACVESPRDDLIVSFRVLPDGTLRELDTVHTTGANIAHLEIDRAHRRLFTVNFSGCSAAMIAYGEDGSLRLCDCCHFTDQGSYTLGVSTFERQDGAKPHASALMPDGRHLCVCSMGSDKLYVLAIDEDFEKLTLCTELTAPIDDGEGARHVVFSADGKFAYTNSEMGNTVYVFAVGEDCSLTRLQKLSLLDPERETKGWASVCVLSPDGRYLFVGSRGQNCIVRFRVGDDGLLTQAGYFDCCGTSPRGLSFGYGGRVLFCCCNGSGTIAVIGFDPESGEPGECLQKIEGIPGAANVVFQVCE